MFEGPVQDLIDELGRLPGVGPKSAQRIAFHLLAADPADVSRLQDVLQKVKQGVRFYEVCGNVAAAQRCRYCSRAARRKTRSAASRWGRSSIWPSRPTTPAPA